MIVDIEVPDLGESINEVEIGEWLVQVGEQVKADQEIVAIESDKATVELPAPAGGVLVKIIKKQGEAAAIGEVIGRIDTEQGSGQESGGEEETGKKQESGGDLQEEKEPAGGDREKEERKEGEKESAETSEPRVMPAAERLLAKHDMAVESVTATGPGGRILKEDVLRAIEERSEKEKKEKKATEPAPESDEGKAAAGERRVPMTPIRRTIAARLLEAKQSMALLTTFNEADMSEVKRARSEFGQEFFDKFGVRLGFMSFFIRATVAALGDFPLVNAAIDGQDIVYHDSCDIGVAIGGGKGLVVPVLRRAERMSFADIEQKIAELAEKAKKNSLTIDELTGGTFTISNGGVYGSMLSTPIVNPPQSAILGLHAIKDRPVAIGGEVKIRPIMYLALSYDHRIVDGREAVSFLKGIKERIEQPQKLLLEI